MAPIRAAVARAQKFVLSRDAVAMALHVAKSKPTSILRAMDLIRAPYEKVWLKWAAQDERDADDDTRRDDPDRPRHQRTGALIESMDETLRRWRVTLAWSHKASGVSVGLLGFVMDWNPDSKLGPGMNMFGDPMQDVSRMAEAASGDVARRFRAILRDPAEREALTALNTKVFMMPNGYMTPLFQEAERHSGQARLLDAIASTSEDVQNEVPFIASAFVLINSRNAIEAKDADIPEKLNRARARSGKRPMLEHKVLDLKISKVFQARLAAAGVSPRDMRAHLVRGHYKVRRTGVYWWSPHVRGDEVLGFVHKDYAVQG